VGTAFVQADEFSWNVLGTQTLASLISRFKDLLEPVTRVAKNKKKEKNV
jgi:hypothetical protein